MRFGDAAVIVTGAGSGIGKELAHRFASEGAMVAVADLDSERAALTAEEVMKYGHRTISVAVDVGDESQVASMTNGVIAKFGRVDVLVNNAANEPSDDMLKMSVEEWDRDIRVSLRGPFLCMRSVLPDMLQRGCGVIVNIASINAFAFYGNEAYSAAKAGLISLTRAAAVRYGARGIRSNAVAPGTVRTPMWSARLHEDPKVLERAKSWYPVQRVGEVREVADAALFLASDDASWITGVVLPVDGGLSAGNYRLTSELVRESDWTEG